MNSNIDGIKSFRDGKLIRKSKNKLSFTAFCFEYNRLLDCLDDPESSVFTTHLPIQLDGTCNGFQHLSLLSLDTKLASELNLTSSTSKDHPKDFYTFLSDAIKCNIGRELGRLKNHEIKLIELEKDNKENQENISRIESYERLMNFDLKRHIMKKSIMTIPYNVSDYRLVNYIKENFEWDHESKVYISKKDGNKSQPLQYADFRLLGEELRKVLVEYFPKLSRLISYLEDVVNICTALSLPVV